MVGPHVRAGDPMTAPPRPRWLRRRLDRARRQVCRARRIRGPETGCPYRAGRGARWRRLRLSAVTLSAFSTVPGSRRPPGRPCPASAGRDGGPGWAETGAALKAHVTRRRRTRVVALSSARTDSPRRSAPPNSGAPSPPRRRRRRPASAAVCGPLEGHCRGPGGRFSPRAAGEAPRYRYEGAIERRLRL